MNKIEELLTQYCPEGVEYKPLGEVGEFSRGGGLQKKNFTDEGIGCIHYGQVYTHYSVWATETKSFVSPEFAAKKRKMKQGDIFIATTSENDEDLGKAVAWLGDHEIVASGDGFIFAHEMDPKFVSYFFSSTLFQRQKQRFVTGTKVRRISGDSLAKIEIPVPPVEVQRPIVEILDTFMELEAELEAELETRTKQYEHYRQQLFTFSGNTEWSPMGEMLDLRAGRSIKASEISPTPSEDQSVACYGGNGVRGFVSDSNHEGVHSLIGRQGALCGNVNRASGLFFATEHAVVVTPKKPMNASWLYHLLKSMNLNQYATKSAQPGLSVARLNRVAFPRIPLEEQSRVGNTLDKFDALINDLSSGLPAEIEARRKQYAYYRDQLFSLPAKA